MREKKWEIQNSYPRKRTSLQENWKRCIDFYYVQEAFPSSSSAKVKENLILKRLSL